MFDTIASNRKSSVATAVVAVTLTVAVVMADRRKEGAGSKSSPLRAASDTGQGTIKVWPCSAQHITPCRPTQHNAAPHSVEYCGAT